MKILIVSGGKAPSKALLQNEKLNSDYIICADSGANCLYEYGIVPDYLLGDFDSIDKRIYEHFLSMECSKIEYPVEKDCTDTQLALYKAIEIGAKEIVFLGCTGTRIDHVLGNLGLLKICQKHSVAGYMKDDNCTIFLIDKGCEISGHIGETFSVQAYCDVVKGLSINGAKYPLKNYDLELGDPITVSNIFKDEKVQLTFTSGNLLFIYSQD